MHQREYCEELLKRWNMDRANPALTTGVVDSYAAECRGRGSEDPAKPRDIQAEDEARAIAQAVLGGINWLATRTHPDVAYQTGQAMTKVAGNPEAAAKESKRILRYLAGTREAGLAITPEAKLKQKPQYDNNNMLIGPDIEAYSDASFCPTGGRSPIGMVMLLAGR